MKKPNTIYGRILNALIEIDEEWVPRGALVNKVFAATKKERVDAVDLMIKEEFIEEKIRLKVGKGKNAKMLRPTKLGVALRNKLYRKNRIT